MGEMLFGTTFSLIPVASESAERQIMRGDFQQHPAIRVPGSTTSNPDIQGSRYLSLGTWATRQKPNSQEYLSRRQVRTPQVQALFGEQDSQKDTWSLIKDNN